MISIMTSWERWPTLIFANISLNLSKSVRFCLLFWTMSFLPQELLSHFFLTSARTNSQLLLKKKNTTLTAKMIHVHSQLTVLTSFLHSIQQFLLLGNPLNVNFNVSQRKPLEIHLGPFHVRSINKSLYQLMKQM